MFLFLFFGFTCCGQKAIKPSFLDFDIEKDSISIYAENKLGCPTHLIVTYKKSNKTKKFELNPYEKIMIDKRRLHQFDSISYIDNHNFSMRFGSSYPIKEYDTFYNYSLPFLKGKRYKVLQGQNTSFTHNTPTSKYAIDFKMNIGDTICAIREGIVVAIKQNSDKGGRSKKYFDYANYVMLYHPDGLFSQYVHLKKEGVLVKLGDTVKKHQPIAYSGNTGMSTEPHLHFGVFKSNTKGFISIPFILDSIPTINYKKGKFALNN
jgi:murein DD-endopeptidase MepM/ murein hydrolase activator NlpD